VPCQDAREDAKYSGYLLIGEYSPGTSDFSFGLGRRGRVWVNSRGVRTQCGCNSVGTEPPISRRPLFGL